MIVLDSILHRLKRSCAPALSSLTSDTEPAKAYIAEATPAAGAPQKFKWKTANLSGLHWEMFLPDTTVN